jgi:hypothetical protein
MRCPATEIPASVAAGAGIAHFTASMIAALSPFPGDLILRLQARYLLPPGMGTLNEYQFVTLFYSCQLSTAPCPLVQFHALAS